MSDLLIFIGQKKQVIRVRILSYLNDKHRISVLTRLHSRYQWIINI